MAGTLSMRNVPSRLTGMRRAELHMRANAVSRCMALMEFTNGGGIPGGCVVKPTGRTSPAEKNERRKATQAAHERRSNWAGIFS